MNLKKRVIGVVLVGIMCLGGAVNVLAKDNTQDIKFQLENGKDMEVQIVEHNYLGTIEVNIPVILKESLDKTQYKKTKVDVIRRNGDDSAIATFKVLKGTGQADSADGVISFYPYHNNNLDISGDYNANFINSQDVLCKGYSKMPTYSVDGITDINNIKVMPQYKRDFMVDINIQYYKDGNPCFYISSGKMLILSDDSIDKFLKTGELEMYKEDTTTWEPLRELLLNQGSKENSNVSSSKKTNVSNAARTTSNIMVNNKKVDLEAYTINNNTYFKLRDLAYIINGTEKQFNVEWDDVNRAISILSNIPYRIQGNELGLSSKNTNQEAVISESKIYMDGTEVSLSAYNIKGSTYFKLRDLAEKLNINIQWSQKDKSISIDTTKDYTQE